MRYFIDTHPSCDGNHELHQNGCVVFPKRETVVLVGEFRTSYEALRAAATRPCAPPTGSTPRSRAAGSAARSAASNPAPSPSSS